MNFRSSPSKPMKKKETASRAETAHLKTDELRSRFLLQDLFAEGKLTLFYTDVDRAIVGAACPRNGEVPLEATDALRARFFCERRELGVINLGASRGTVEVDGTPYVLERLECLYIGRGSETVKFIAAGDQAPDFYLVSYPAHQAYPSAKATLKEANRLDLGGGDYCNERTIFQFIHEDGIQSCQLVMGFTQIATGSVWNTMPAHTHDRRSEVYLYFDVPDGHTVFHFMGEPQQTRHLCLHNKEAVLSPAWSIHSGCGTAAYSFVWAMGGENQRFDDMDPAPIADLR
jgi:4-deoxy-L-threo-5-hexosulose-uronate ketol-isomerase